MTKTVCEINRAIAKVERLLANDEQVSPALRAAVLVLISEAKLLFDRVNYVDKHRRNSSKPPSSDPNRVKKSRTKSKNPIGGQAGHDGTTLCKIDNPDEIKLELIQHVGYYAISGYLESLIADLGPAESWPIELPVGEAVEIEGQDKRFRIKLLHGRFTAENDLTNRVLLRTVWLLRKPLDNDPFNLEWAVETSLPMSQKLDTAYAGG